MAGAPHAWEFLLKLGLATLERGQLGALRAQDAKQLLDLNLLGERDAAKLLDVRLAP
jgi:hypothetical protein